MVRRKNLHFHRSHRKIREPVTKFGGQPVWVGEPEWPISRSTNIPMRFLCQIALSDVFIAKGYEGKMAYLFMTDVEPQGSSGPIVDNQYDPNCGENAVILQPGKDRIVDTKPIVDGPSLQLTQEISWGWEPEKNAEFAVSLIEAEDPNLIPESEFLAQGSGKIDEYCKAIAGNKLGGTPNFIQGDEFPFTDGRSALVLQLHQGEVPFFVNFGDVGTGYLFVEIGGDSARFLWQCG